MTTEKVERRLAAILSADVVGYSRLVRADEEGTLAHLSTHLEDLILPTIAEHHGRVVKLMGDGVLAEFASVVDAVRCAADVQRAMADRNAEVAVERKIQFRIGINLGDIVVSGDDIHGDGVNVAARLQELADPGGLIISGTAFDHAVHKVDLGFEDLGGQRVKNIADPVRAYRVLLEPEAVGSVLPHKEARKRLPERWRWAIPAAAALVVIGVAAAVLLSLEPWVPRVEAAVEANMDFPLPEKPSIVVLPFDNVGDDPEQAFFADGVTGDIIAHLSQDPRLFIADRGSAFSFKDKSATVKEVSEALGMRYVLQGSIQRSGDKLRITAEFIDALSGKREWSERYDREMGDLFALQDDITKNVSVAVGVAFEGEYAREVRARSGDSLEAWELHARASYYSFLPGKENNDKSRELLLKAIEVGGEQPAFLVDLGWRYFLDKQWGYSDDPEGSLAKAHELAAKAYELDKKFARTLILMGLLAGTVGNHADMLGYARAAAELGPSDAEVLALLASFLGDAGRPDEALPLIERAMRLEPFGSYLPILGDVQLTANRFDDAIATFRTMAENDIGWIPGHGYIQLAATYALMGRLDEAAGPYAAYLEISPDISIDLLRNMLSFKTSKILERRLAAYRALGIPEHPPLPLPDKPSIAVLPFDDLSDDPEQEYFVDGMTDTLITDLSQISGLFVIASNTSFTYKGKLMDVKVVGRELGVRYILEGSVQRASGRVRINVQLIDVQTGGHIWSERFDRPYEDIFALQDDAINEIITALSVVSRERDEGKVPTPSLEAYDLYLRGMQSIDRLNREDLDRSIDLFEQALRLDPDFALAHGALAWAGIQVFAWGLVSQKGAMNPGLAYSNAWDAAENALKYDPELAIAHAVLARLRILDRSRHDRFEYALRSAKDAVSLAPIDPDVLATYAVVLNSNGEHERALSIMKDAYRLNPKPSPRYAMDMAFIQFHLGRYAEAVEHATLFQREVPESYFASWILTPAFAFLGRSAEASAQLAVLKNQRPDLSLQMLEEFSPMQMRLRKDRGRLIEGFRHAGAPIYKGEANLRGEQLHQDEIAALLTGRTIGGRDFATNVRWWYRQESDGRARRWDGNENETTGVFTVENDWACWEWDDSDDYKRCSHVYGGSKGTPQKLDEYLLVGTGCGAWANDTFQFKRSGGVCSFAVED